MFDILFCHLNRSRISHFGIRSPILTFKLGPNISYLNIRKSYFNIWIRAEYRILTFEFLFLHSNSGRMSHFNIRINFMTLERRPNILFWHSKCWFDILTGAKYYILIFEFLIYNVTWEIGPNISFWNSKFCFDIRILAKYRISTFEIIFLTFELRPDISFWHSKSFFDIRNRGE